MARLRLQFDFMDTAPDEGNKVRCGVCFNLFEYPEIGTNLTGFTICPTCVLSGPVAVAAEALRSARNKDRLAIWSEDPDDQRDFASDYRSIARMLRRVESFMDIPGGAHALAIASVKPEDVERGYRRRKAA